MGLRTWFEVINDVMLQRWHTRHLSSNPRDVCGPDVEGRTFIVTGPTSGIGTTTAETLARMGARVVLACRTVKRGRALVDAWNADAKAEGASSPLDCDVVHLDLDSLDSVRAFCQEFNARGVPLHCLINNAGVFDMSGAHRKTKDGHEQHYGTNYLAPALLSLLLMPSLKRAGTPGTPARVVFVCSKLHEFCAGLQLDDLGFERRSYAARAAYAQSKLAELLFVRELERRMGVEEGDTAGRGGGVTAGAGQGLNNNSTTTTTNDNSGVEGDEGGGAARVVHSPATGGNSEGDSGGVAPAAQCHVRALAVHPGNIITGVVRTLPGLVQVAYKLIMGFFLLTPREGARASLYAATSREALEVPGLAPYFTSDCVVRAPSGAAVDDEAAAALWDATLETLGVAADWRP